VFDGLGTSSYEISGVSGAICSSPTAELSDDPTPIYQRGVWFDGENDFLLLQNFVFGHTFQIELWTKIYGNSTLFSMNKFRNDD
jgi:hypothetical protein